MRRFAYRAVLWCGGAVTVALAAAAALTVSLTDRSCTGWSHKA